MAEPELLGDLHAEGSAQVCSITTKEWSERSEMGRAAQFGRCAAVAC